MHDEHTLALRAVLLPGFGVLRIAGTDAIKFLQGQFTNDVRLLADGRTQVSACCTNQGRVIALARLRQTDDRHLRLRENPKELAAIVHFLKRGIAAHDQPTRWSACLTTAMTWLLPRPQHQTSIGPLVGGRP